MHIFSRLLKATLLALLINCFSSQAMAATCTANTNPTTSCTGLSITGNNLNINIPTGIVLDGGDSISVSAGSTGLNLTVQSGATVGNSSMYPLRNYGGNINSITNLGYFRPGMMGGGLNNGSGTISTLNNLQGASGALRYNGTLPSNYNIIINSTSDFGKLSASGISGATTFGISALSGANIGASGTRYQDVISGLTAGYITNEAITLTYIDGPLTATYQLVADDSNVSGTWDLSILSVLTGPSTVNTQTSLEANASALKGIYNLQSSIINNGLSYDCALFDVHGLCLSTGGRYSNTNTPTGDSAGALVIGAYRLNEQVRVGVYLDQGGVSNSLPSGLHLKQGNPLFGAFAVWQANQDGLGAQIKLATGYDEANLSVTRAVVGTSEAGTGTTELSSQALSLVGSYGFEMQGGWLATPYAGLRRSQVKADGYTESDAIDAPLTYGKLKQAATTLQLGVKASANLSSQLAINGSLGIEHDTNNNQGVYSASGVDNLTAIVFNSNINKTRPVASLGATLSVDNRQQLAFNLMYREEAFSHSSSTSAYGTYTIGF